PTVFLTSVGQVALVPVQVSATSHSPAAARHSVPLGQKVQLFLQHELPAIPGSHCSPESSTPLPQLLASLNVVCATKPERCPVLQVMEEGRPRLGAQDLSD